jgi:Na+-driven multidrug efflux pump
MVKEIFRRLVPFSMAVLVLRSVELINFGFIGHLEDPTALGALGLAQMMVNLFATAIV